MKHENIELKRFEDHRSFVRLLRNMPPGFCFTLSKIVLILGLALLAAGCDDSASNSSTHLVIPDSSARIDRALNDLEALPTDRREMVKDSLAQQILAAGTPEQRERFSKITGSSIKYHGL